MESLSLRGANEHRHGGRLPPTCIDGSVPIDGIFISPRLLEAVKFGHFAFWDATDDVTHRALWFDLPIAVVFGNKLHPL